MAGRLEVMRTLAERFPRQPHYSAHLGRMYSYEARDHVRALEAVERAIALAPDDDALYHMKGVILRNQMRTTIDNRESVTAVDLRDRVLSIVADARREFEQAIHLNDSSDFGYVALAQLCIQAIEFGRGQSDTPTYGSFLSQPGSGPYRELLAVAEDSVDRIGEIRGGDRPSRYSASVEAAIRAFYDDCSPCWRVGATFLTNATFRSPRSVATLFVLT